MKLARAKTDPQTGDRPLHRFKALPGARPELPLAERRGSSYPAVCLGTTSGVPYRDCDTKLFEPALDRQKEEDFTMRGSFYQDETSVSPQPSCVPIPAANPSENAAEVLQFQAGGSGRRSLPSTLKQGVEIQPANRRCSVKGCVFPATSAQGTCVQH